MEMRHDWHHFRLPPRGQARVRGPVWKRSWSWGFHWPRPGFAGQTPCLFGVDETSPLEKEGVLFRQPQLAARGSNARPRTGRVPKFPSLPKSVMGRKGSRVSSMLAGRLAGLVSCHRVGRRLVPEPVPAEDSLPREQGKARSQQQASKQASLWPAVRRMSQRREAPSSSAPGSISSPNRRPGQCQWLAAEGRHRAPVLCFLWCSSGASCDRLFVCRAWRDAALRMRWETRAWPDE